MKIQEIRGKDSRELHLDVQAMRKELFELRLRASSEEIANASRFRDLRRVIARVNTVLRERELSGAGVSGGTAVKAASDMTPDQPES